MIHQADRLWETAAIGYTFEATPNHHSIKVQKYTDLLRTTAMRSNLFVTGLTIALGLATPIVSAIGFPEIAVAQTVDQRKVEADRLLKEGNIQLEVNKNKEAVSLLEKSLKLYQELRDREGEGQVLKSLGNAYLGLKQYEKARELFQQSLSIAREIKNQDLAARSLNNIGVTYKGLNKLEKAIEYCQQSLLISRKIKNRLVEGIVLGNLGDYYNSLENYAKAIEYHEQNLVIARELKDRKGQGSVLGNLGNAYYFLGNYPKAIDYHEQSLAIARELKDRLGQGIALGNLGNAYYFLGNYPKVIDYHEQSLAIKREIKDQLGEGQSLGSLGNVYQSLGNYPKAIDYHEQSLAIARVIKDRNGEGNALGNLGLTYNSLGNYAKAIDYHEQHLAIKRAIKDRLGEGNALGNLGNAHHNLGNYARAIDYHEQYLAIAREIKNRQGEGSALGNLGNAHHKLGSYSRAIDYYKQLLAIAREIKDRLGEGTVLGNLGATYGALGNYPKTIDYHEKHLAIAREIKDRGGEYRGLNNIAATLKKQNQPDLAIVFYKQSINVSESIRKDNRPLSRELQASYTESVAFTYRALADLLLSQGRIGEAQKVLELLKVQELNDITEGSRSPSPQQNQVALSKVEEQIIQKHTSLIQFGQLLSECKQSNCARLDEYKTTHRQLTEAYDKFIEDLRTQLVADRDKSIAATTDDFIGGAGAIVNNQPNTVLIYPLVLKDKTRILWASKGGILSQAECPLGEAQLSTLVKDFRTALQTSDDLNPVQKTGQQLYNCLLPQKLRDELTKNKIDNLVFVPDRITNYIPMAALHDGKNYLIENFAVSNILSVGLTDTKDKLPDRPSVLGFGLSTAVTLSNPDRSFSSLPFVPIELEGMVKKANASSDSRGIFAGTTWLDRDFSRSNLETKLVSQKPNILHIATHGEFVPASPKTSYLVLGDGTPYAISQIQYLNDLENVHLVVLSACETALGGSDSNGLEIAGIASYFIRSQARAKAVLASLWKVNDPATSILMSQFYSSLSTDRLTKSQSLRKVQREMINSKLTLQDAATRAGVRLYEPNKKRPQNLSHPYYWAPFILIGNNQ